MYLSGMVRSVREAFLEALEVTRLSVAEVSRRAQVSEEQLKKLKNRPGAKTNADDAVKIAHAFGMSIDEFLQDDMVALRSDIVWLYNQLEPSEIAVLKDAARGRRERESNGG